MKASKRGSMATRAGVAQAVQLDGRLGLESWLHALFEDLLAHKSRELFAADKDDGIILRVCEASATYSARLERKGIGAAPRRGAKVCTQFGTDESELVAANEGGSGLNYKSELKRLIALQFAKNPKASDLEVCRGLDADGGLELPTRWAVGKNRLFDVVYRDPRPSDDIRTFLFNPEWILSEPRP